MQITLLPPLLPTEGVTSVPVTHMAFTPGARILATVLATGLEGGGTLLSMGGRDVPTGGPLPYPPGSTLRLEVLQGGAQPQLRLLSVEAPSAVGHQQAASPAGPPVSAVSYGLAAAVLAARDGGDVRSAAVAVSRWIPALVTGGLVPPAQAEVLLSALAPVPLHSGPAGSPDNLRAAEAMARALADRVADGGLLLERRLGDVVRQARPEAREAVAGDLRARLAIVAHVLGDAPAEFEGARQAVAALQSALLGEQARAAAHLAHDGVVDVRVPAEVDGRDTELRMRIARDAPERGRDEDPAPWRQVRLDLALDGLGQVQVRVGVLATQVRLEFFVEHAGSADRIEAGLADLNTALEGAGFAHVLSRVVVDPVTACAPDALPELPQRAILDVEA
jgi:hypothetical protein